MRDLLKTYFGYDAFRPLQEEIIRTVLGGEDALVLMPTGGGKSLCYQLPALAFPGITLVVSPLIALMKDQVDALTANGVPAAFLNSSLAPREAADVEDRARDGRLKILYVAPERLSAPSFQALLRDLRVSFLAVDEAHCISEWGHDFRPDYRNLRELRRAFPGVPVMALTATAPPRVRADIVEQLGLGAARAFVSSFNRPNLRYAVRPKQNALGQLVRALEPYRGQPAIVYCFSRKDTEDVADGLRRAGFDALPYHAGLEREERRRAQERFIRDEVPVVVATIAFGMGIDKPDVRLVAHMDLPKSIEGYYQETGRAGRDGLPSECVLFYSYGDKRKQEFFIAQAEDEAERAAALRKLARMIEYCETSGCRRKFLIEYFGEAWEGGCGACDNCLDVPAEEHDATEIAQKILSAVLRTGEAFGAAYVCDVLRGSRKERVVENRHDALPVYGIARDVPADTLRAYVGSLLRKGYLEKNDGDYPTLRVSRAGRAALAERAPIALPRPEEPARAAPVRSATVPAGTPAYDPELFELLRRERARLAAAQNVPPFVVFGDRTLHDLAYHLPRTSASFGRAFGVGEAKLRQYGDAFLAVIRAFADARGLPERPRAEADAPSRPSATPRAGTTIARTRELVERGLTVAQMAHERGVTEGTIIQHVVALAAEDPALNIHHLRPARLDAIRRAFDEAGTRTLTPVKQRLGEEYSFDELRLARLFLSQ